jgi:hypothetical protein
MNASESTQKLLLDSPRWLFIASSELPGCGTIIISYTSASGPKDVPMLLKSWPQPSSLHQSSFFLDPYQVIALAPSVAGTGPNSGGWDQASRQSGQRFF